MKSDENESLSLQSSGRSTDDVGENCPSENKPFHVVLKGGSPWGFALRGGSKVRAPLQINEIHHGGKAEENGEMCTGDYVLSINDVHCSSLDEAEQLVQSAFRTLTLLVWRGNVQTKALLRSSSFLRQAREIQERERNRSGIQDDSIVFSESKTTVGLNMKAKQRRIESFNGGKAGGRTVATSSGGRIIPLPSTSLSSPLSPSVYADYGLQKPPSPRLTTTAPPTRTKKLANWATIPDLSSKNRPLSVRTTLNVGYQNSRCTGPLSPAKSSPSLNHMAENVLPYSQYAPYTNTQTTSIAYAMSTPDVSDQMSAPRDHQSPSWYQQQKIAKPLFDFSLSDRDLRERVVDNGQYANPTYSEFAARLNAVKKPERRSLPTNMMPRYNDYQNLKDLPVGNNLESIQTKQNSYSIDDSFDNEIPDIPPPRFEDDSRPLYSPPAPPVRDISSLKYIGMNQAHEKYPSWPVNSPNTDMSVPEAARSPASSWLDGSKFDVKKMSNQPYQPQLHPLKEGNSPITEYRSEEKPSRNASDPGFKSPSPLKKFIKRKVPTSKDKELSFTENKSNHFEEIIKSKPGYPLPVRDSDGHSYGDEKYSIPSPPERDMPGVDEKCLGEKMTSLVAPSYVDQYQGELRVSTDQKKDSTTTPLQSQLVANHTGSAYHYKSNIPLKAFPISETKVDMATSPLQSPNDSKFILGGLPNNNLSVASQQPWEKNRGYIVRQMVTPYYNTGTQTDDIGKSSKSQAMKPRHFLPDSQPTRTQGENKRFHDMSVQVQMSSQSSDSDAVSPKDDITVSTVDGEASLIQSIPSDYSAPMLRKLSEEYFQGRLQGGHIDKRHSTSSSFDLGARSPTFGSLKEAGSYSSVIIHPGESSKPFGKDYENISEQDSLSYERDSNYSVYKKPSKGRYSLDPSMLSTQNSLNMPQRSLQDSRYNSEQLLSSPNYSNLTDNNVSASMLDIKFEQARVSQYSSSDTSLPSQPHSSDDTRTSKSTSFGSDYSPLGTQNVRLDPNDSVFTDNTSQAATVSNFTESQNMMSRKSSMKKAYGAYDEFEKLLGTHKRQQSDPTSNFMKDRHSNSDYVIMNSYRGLDQILEDSAESRWAETVKKSQNLYQNAVDVNKDIINKESEKKGENSASNECNLSADRDYEEIDISKTVSDLTTINIESTNLCKENVQKRSPKENETDNTMMADHRNLSDPDLRKVQQDAVLNFMERCTKTRRPASFHIRKPSPSSTNDMPSPGEQSPRKINIQISKIQRPENLRRTRSISSPKHSNTADYVEMKHPQTEWRTVRSQTSTSINDSFKRPSSLGSEASLSDTYAISPLSPCSSSASNKPSDIHSRTYSDSGSIKQMAALQKNRSSSAGEQKLSPTNAESSKSAGSGSQTVTPPLYQNIRYLRPPPVPPPDDGVVEDKPPALPPRNYNKFHISHSDSALRTSHEAKKDSSVLSSSHNQNTDSPQDSSQDSYRDELRKYAKIYSKQQFQPAAFSLVSTKTPSSCSQSFKREPVRSYEATSPQGSVSTSPLTTSNSNGGVSSYSVREQNESRTAALLRGDSPEPPPLPPLPSPSRSLEELSNDVPPLPPPPPPTQPTVGSADIQESIDSRGYADDSYGSAVFQKYRQPGVYKRSGSAGDGLRALAEKNNNYKEQCDVNCSPQRLDQSQRTNEQLSVKQVNSEQQQDSESSVPLFQAALVEQQNVYKYTAQPLPPAQKKTPVTPNPLYLSSKAFSSDTSKSTVASSGFGERPFVKSNSTPDVLVPQTNAAHDSQVGEHKSSLAPSSGFGERPFVKSNSTPDVLASQAKATPDSQDDEHRSTVAPSSGFSERPFVTSNFKPDVLATADNPVDEQTKEHTSVKDRIFKLEKISRSPNVEPVRHLLPKINLRIHASNPRNSLENLSRSKDSSPKLPARTYLNKQPTQNSPGNQKHISSPQPLPRTRHLRHPPSPREPLVPSYPKQSTQSQFSPLSKPPLPSSFDRTGATQFGTSTQNRQGDQNSFHVSENSPKVDWDSSVHSVSVNQHIQRNISPKHNNEKFTASDKTISSNTNIQNVQGQSKVLSEIQYAGDVLSSYQHSGSSSERSSLKVSNENETFGNRTDNLYLTESFHHSFDGNTEQLNKSDELRNENLERTSTSSDVFVDNVSADNKLQVIHSRQPSQEELECEVKVQELVKELPESDKNLTDVLKPENKGRMHYMNGLFMDSLSISRESVGSRHSPTSISKQDSQPSSQDRTSEQIEDSTVGRKECTSLPPSYWVSTSRAMMELEIRKCDEAQHEFIKDIDNNDTLMKKKGELMDSIMKKIDILKEERRELQKEIEYNDSIGRKIDGLVDQKCQGHRRDKFRSYIDDMDKIVKLLLKLSGLLARAENAVQSLPANAADHQKKSALEKRDKLREQHEEAQGLKTDIDKRKESVSTFLSDCFTESQLEDYTYFVKMKSKLTIQTQELDDKIRLGVEQLQALQRSIPDSS